MSELPKLNPPIDLAEVPRPGTVTAVSSGTAAVVEWLREVNTLAGPTPDRLHAKKSPAYEVLKTVIVGRYCISVPKFGFFGERR